ncbi:hypothetical protein D3C72_2043090 [compost metagenome]
MKEASQMKQLTRSQWIAEEIQPLLSGNVSYVILLLYPKEMRELKKKNKKIHYNGRENNHKRKSDTRVSYKITL